METDTKDYGIKFSEVDTRLFRTGASSLNAKATFRVTPANFKLRYRLLWLGTAATAVAALVLAVVK